jgi:hypothetical protein
MLVEKLSDKPGSFFFVRLLLGLIIILNLSKLI